jgi:ubiquinone/menaquinone biosynthesis C-methylase UbiE
MSHVLEHVPNPNEWLQKAKEVLLPDGVLVINVPHKHSFSNKLQYFYYKLGLKKRVSSGWNDSGRTPDHLFEPTVKSMQYLVTKNGFKVLDYFSYSRKDPASNKSIYSKLKNRKLMLGTNLSFIVTPNN